MRVFDDIIFDSETTSNDTSTSEAVSLEHIYGVSIYASWSGTTISGNIKIEASVDGDNWADLSDTQQTINSADNYLWNLPDLMFKFFRVSVTSDDANTITTTCKYYGKGV